MARARTTVAISSDFAARLLSDRADADTRAWVADLAARVDESLGVRISLGELGLRPSTSEALARAVVGAFLEHQQAYRGLPRGAVARIERIEPTQVPHDRARRTILPHHDGGRSSFLTPSKRLVPNWPGELRSMVRDAPAQKLYQGFFIVDPGPPGASTGYFPWVRLLARAYTRQLGRFPDARELATWLGENIRRTIDSVHGSAEHLSLLSALGSPSSVEARSPLHAAHEGGEDGRRCPPCGQDCRCERDAFAERRWCAGLRETVGMSWATVRETWQTSIVGRRHDLVLGHNLFAVHAGFAGGAERVLLPLSIAIAEPRGPDYEEWLLNEWERAFASQCRS